MSLSAAASSSELQEVWVTSDLGMIRFPVTPEDADERENGTPSARSTRPSFPAPALGAHRPPPDPSGAVGGLAVGRSLPTAGAERHGRCRPRPRQDLFHAEGRPGRKQQIRGRGFPPLVDAGGIPALLLSVPQRPDHAARLPTVAAFPGAHAFSQPALVRASGRLRRSP